MLSVTGYIRPRSALRDLEMTGIIRRFPKLAATILRREMNLAWNKALRIDDDDQPGVVAPAVGVADAHPQRRQLRPGAGARRGLAGCGRACWARDGGPASG